MDIFGSNNFSNEGYIFAHQITADSGFRIKAKLPPKSDNEDNANDEDAKPKDEDKELLKLMRTVELADPASKGDVSNVQAWLDGHNLEKETIAMMRFAGLESSCDHRLEEQRTAEISNRNLQFGVSKNRGKQLPVLYDEKYFEFGKPKKVPSWLDDAVAVTKQLQMEQKQTSNTSNVPSNAQETSTQIKTYTGYDSDCKPLWRDFTSDKMVKPDPIVTWPELSSSSKKKKAPASAAACNVKKKELPKRQPSTRTFADVCKVQSPNNTLNSSNCSSKSNKSMKSSEGSNVGSAHGRRKLPAWFDDKCFEYGSEPVLAEWMLKNSNETSTSKMGSDDESAYGRRKLPPWFDEKCFKLGTRREVPAWVLREQTDYRYD